MLKTKMTLTGLFNKLKRSKYRSTTRAVGIILLAAALIEGLSLMQYRYAHRLLQEQLDYNVESELTMKSMRVRGILKSHEKVLRNQEWQVQQALQHPDSLYGILKRFVATNPDVISSFVAFVPEHLQDKGNLFEPTAYRKGQSIITKQMGSKEHDYTQREFYHLAIENNLTNWSDPYIDTNASGAQVTTFAVPLSDATGKTVATFGLDLSTKGIIDTLNSKNTYHNYPSSFFLLLTEDGKLISKPDSTHSKLSDVDAVVKKINDSTIKRESSTTGHSKFITFHDKHQSTGYAYYANMRGATRWRVVMVCYEDEVFHKLNVMRRNLLLMMLAGFTLLGFILYRFNRNLKRLHESRLSKERTDSELNIAQKIQSEMLPSTNIARPDVDVSGKQITALEVGGDLYGYFIRDEKLFFCIGDVSGKGVPSSLVMAVVHSLFNTLAQHESNPAHIMQSINATACEGNKTNMFVTMFIGVLDLPTGRLRYCNAGHDAPLIISHGVTALRVTPNLPLGVFDDTTYLQQEEQLPPETTLLLYTDGLTEMSDSEHNMFGLQRIVDTARTCLEQGMVSPSELMESQYAAALRLANGAQQFDDLTMLCIHYHRHDESTVLTQSLTLANDVKQVPELNKFVKSVTEQLNLEASLSSQLMLAVEEAVVNVMNYAYPIGIQGKVNITAHCTEHSIKFIITDEGKAFDPTLKSDADTTLSAEERPIGGLGILLVQRLMDSINYERIDGKNVLTLKKEYKQKQ